MSAEGGEAKAQAGEAGRNGHTHESPSTVKLGDRVTESDNGEGWHKVGKKAKTAAAMVEVSGEGKTASAVKQEGGARDQGNLSPQRKPRVKKLNEMISGGNARQVEQGDGKATFKQLYVYLEHDAPMHYICQTVLRLRDLAIERRFRAFRTKMLREGMQLNEHDLRSRWMDAITPAQQEKYKGIKSYWDLNNSSHLTKFVGLLKTCMVLEKLPQSEVEMRMRFLHFEPDPRGKPHEDSNPMDPGSYLRAVFRGSHGTKALSQEQMQLRELCIAPAVALTTLRQRTQEEDQALLAILNHELEVPAPPPFLLQSMTAGELARFTDIFLALEYPLYAHLAPGQRFGEGLTKQIILSHIQAGAEAAEAQKQEVHQFKQDISHNSGHVIARGDRHVQG